MFDTDEIAMPQRHKNWHELFEVLEKEDFDAVSFRHTYFFGNVSRESKAKRSKSLQSLRPHLYGTPLKLEQDLRARFIFSEGATIY